MMRLRFLPLLLLALAPASQAKVEWTYTFDSLKPGNLIGQDGWSDYNPGPNAVALPPRVVEADTPGHRLVLAQQPAADKTASAISRGRKTIPNIYDGRTPLVLECDARATVPGSIAVFGFGGADAFPATFGIQFGQFGLREEAFGGTVIPALDASGKRVSPVRGDWYRIRSVWRKDAATGEWTGDLAIRNLSKGETAFTPLCFDRGQKVTSVPLKIRSHRRAYDFDLVVVRVGIPGGEIDNLTISPRKP